MNILNFESNISTDTHNDLIMKMKNVLNWQSSLRSWHC